MAQSIAFKDFLLKIFVVAELMRLRRIDLGPCEAFHRRLLGRPHDPSIDGYRANPAALDYFARLELSAADLAAVETLDLDGGNPIFPYLDPNWHGYTDGIDTVKGLDDLALLPNLGEFGASAFVPDDFDFSSFRGLAKLARIHASLEGYSNVEALLALPALADCWLMSNAVFADVTTQGHATRKVMETLRARGVKIWIHWTSRDTYPGVAPPGAFQ